MTGSPSRRGRLVGRSAAYERLLMDLDVMTDDFCPATYPLVGVKAEQLVERAEPALGCLVAFGFDGLSVELLIERLNGCVSGPQRSRPAVTRSWACRSRTGCGTGHSGSGCARGAADSAAPRDLGGCAAVHLIYQPRGARIRVQTVPDIVRRRSLRNDLASVPEPVRDRVACGVADGGAESAPPCGSPRRTPAARHPAPRSPQR